MDRYRAHLRDRYRAIVGYVGMLAAIIGVINLVPVLLIVFYPDEAVHAGGFLLGGLPMLVLGLLAAKRFIPREPISLDIQEGSVVVLLAWLLGILSSAVPMMAGVGLNFSQGVFESTSAWTTTGLSVVDVTTAPNLILFFRSWLQACGGAGFAIIALSAVAGSFASGLSAAEGRTDQLAPNVRQSATLVFRIYIAYNVVGIIALLIAGMEPLDAVVHAFSAVSGGGFSTKVDSIGHWDSLAIEAVIIVLMVLSALNFVIAYTLLQRKFRTAIRNGELRMMLAGLVVGPLLLFGIVVPLYPTAHEGVRAAVFEAASAWTTTGFSTTSYLPWAEFGWLVLISLMLIGGGTGSTAGGIKQLRIYILYKSVIWELKRAFLPKHAINEPAIWHGERRDLLNDKQVRQAALFVGMYITVFFIGSGIIAAHGYTLRESLFEFTSSLSTVGLSVGVTRPDMPLGVMWTQTAGMFLGRLEFFAVLIGVFKLTGDLRQMASRRDD
ncbi:MAG: TrkH family potassium uptake protein [Chloroflexi bacterium]|nr:TrkH family potassium uptake protein [Chloroflexota bacterium]